MDLTAIGGATSDGIIVLRSEIMFDWSINMVKHRMVPEC